MTYTMWAFISVCIFSGVHLLEEKTRRFDLSFRGKLLSVGGGVSIAYVFIDLLPKLSKSDRIISQAFEGVFPFVERHAYIMALVGFLVFFIVDRSHKSFGKVASFWMTFGAYSLFNFLIGYAVSDKNDPEVQPLALFTIAMGLHYFINDYAISEKHEREYDSYGKWVLVASIFAGWVTGTLFVLPASAVALITAFIGGGVIMNVTRHELPADNPHNLGAFLLSTIAYTVILLMLGA